MEVEEPLFPQRRMVLSAALSMFLAWSKPNESPKPNLKLHLAAVVEQDSVVLRAVEDGPLEVGFPFGHVDSIEFRPQCCTFDLEGQEASAAGNRLILSEGPPEEV